MSEPVSADSELLDDVRLTKRGATQSITLERLQTLNAMTDAMRRRISAVLPVIARDPMTYIVLLKSGSQKAFSVGGDVREMVDMARQDPQLAATSFGDEYAMNWLLDCFSKPTVALIDGMVMGGGVGFSIYATHKVAGPGYAFAMPETAIGFFPDVGVSYFLARLPSSIGIYLALTGRRIGRADAYRLGLVTHCIDPEDYEAIEASLCDAWPVDPVLDSRHKAPGPGELEAYDGVIARCFSADTVEDIIARLKAESEHRAWCDDLVRELGERAPFSLKVTLRQVRDAAAMSLKQVLEMDYRIAWRMLQRHDFHEGVRAMLVDKDRQPKWQPAALSEVTQAMIDDVFAPMPGNERILPTRQEMQAQRV